MNQHAHTNPLKKYFRQYAMYLKIPGTNFGYSPDIITFTDSGEVGIMPMTGKDELILKNPDALLNGEAIIEVIKSCVPAVKDPKRLLNNDIDALITAIRHCTYGHALESSVTCPKCEEENTYKLDLMYALENMTFLDESYVVNLDSGLSVFVKPYGFPELLAGLHAQFEQAKLTKALESAEMSEEERLKIFSAAFSKLTHTTHSLLADSVISIVDESSNIHVTDRRDIGEFLANISKHELDLIFELINRINQIGIKKNFSITCSKCNHTWQSNMDFNPANFS